MFAWSVDRWLASWLVGWFVVDSGRPSAWTVIEQVRKTKRIEETRAARFAEPDPASPMEPTEENVLDGSESRQQTQPDSGVNQNTISWCRGAETTIHLVQHITPHGLQPCEVCEQAIPFSHTVLPRRRRSLATTCHPPHAPETTKSALPFGFH